MANRQYIGARYVPLFADPLEWSAGRVFDPLTIVTYLGNSYTSKKRVPADIGSPMDNPAYWALTGSYNAQIEEYRQAAEQAREDSIEAKTEASEASKNADDAKKLANDAKNYADDSFVKATQVGGYKNAVVEVFTDNKPFPSDGVDAFTYLRDSCFQGGWNMAVHNAGSSGWVHNGENNMDARAYIESVCDGMTEAHRESVTLCILSFGFYDIRPVGSVTRNGDYETAGRNIVNVARNYFKNSEIIVLPCITPCYGYDRSAQLNIYMLNYGMVRSQVPVKMIPWYDAFSVNKLQTNHFADGSASDPVTLNAGGASVVGAMIKCAIIGADNAYRRATRTNLANYIDSTKLNMRASELFMDWEHLYCNVTQGWFTPVTTISNNDVVGNSTAKQWLSSYDVILGSLYINNSTSNQLIGFLVYTSSGNILYRALDGKSPETLISGRTYRLSSGMPWAPAW